MNIIDKIAAALAGLFSKANNSDLKPVLIPVEKSKKQPGNRR